MFKKMWCKLFHREYHQRDYSDLKFTKLDVSIWWCQHSCNLCGCAWLVEDEMGRGVIHPIMTVGDIADKSKFMYKGDFSMSGGEVREVVVLQKAERK